MKVSKRTQKRRREVAKLDKECREFVFERDKYACVRCGKKQGIQWAHIITRSDKTLRHDPLNSFALCAGCHIFFWHKHPLEAIAWLRETFPGRYEYLLAKRREKYL